MHSCPDFCFAFVLFQGKATDMNHNIKILLWFFLLHNQAEFMRRGPLHMKEKLFFLQIFHIGPLTQQRGHNVSKPFLNDNPKYIHLHFK